MASVDVRVAAASAAEVAIEHAIATKKRCASSSADNYPILCAKFDLAFKDGWRCKHCLKEFTGSSSRGFAHFNTAQSTVGTCQKLNYSVGFARNMKPTRVPGLSQPNAGQNHQLPPPSKLRAANNKVFYIFSRRTRQLS